MVTQYSTDLRSSVHATDREALDQAETLMGQQNRPCLHTTFHGLTESCGINWNRCEAMGKKERERLSAVRTVTKFTISIRNNVETDTTPSIGFMLSGELLHHVFTANHPTSRLIDPVLGWRQGPDIYPYPIHFQYPEGMPQDQKGRLTSGWRRNVALSLPLLRRHRRHPFSRCRSNDLTPACEHHRFGAVLCALIPQHCTTIGPIHQVRMNNEITDHTVWVFSGEFAQIFAEEKQWVAEKVAASIREVQQSSENA